MSIDANSFNDQHALNYLQEAMKNPKIADQYGIYFGYAEFKAQVIDFKINHFDQTEIQTPEKIVQFKAFKANLANQICEKYFGEIKVQDALLAEERVKRFQELKDFAVKIFVLDKQIGILHLIIRNKERGGFLSMYVEYSYLQVKISDEPKENDWTLMHSKLTTPCNQADGCPVEVWVVDGKKISVVQSGNSQNLNKHPIQVKVNCIWENHKREITPKIRSCHIAYGWDPDPKNFKNRSYLNIDINGSVINVKSHGDETPQFLPNSFLNYYLSFSNETPTDSHHIVISFKRHIEIFIKRSSLIKSAASSLF